MEEIKLGSLSKRRILVTGATKGIGSDTAEKLAVQGANLAIVARSKDDLAETAAHLRTLHPSVKVLELQGDVSKLEDIKRIMGQVKQEYGGLDVLINSAGVNRPKPLMEIEEADWDHILDINLKGAFFLTQQAGAMMKKQGFGKVIHLSSQMGHVGYHGRTVYCASKSGLEGAVKALAVELAPEVRVNTVAPTFIETPLTEDYFADESFKKEVTAHIPLGYIGKPEDVTGAILYLASDLSNLVTGSSLKVDGGWTAW
jgi:NAD(P)-dependent dehydrogenase (short-subunit alcohol dehydrogenase family)